MMKNSLYTLSTIGNGDMKLYELPLLNDYPLGSLLIASNILKIISVCYVTCSSTVKSISLNRSLKENVSERLRRLEVLERVSQELALITDLQRLLEFILNYALEIVPSQEASLVWSDSDKDAFTIRQICGHRQDRSETRREDLTQIERIGPR